MALGSTQPLTEMITNGISWVKGGRCVRLTTFPPSCVVVTKSGSLNFLEPSGPVQACNGTALPLPSQWIIETPVFWDVTPCSWIRGYQYCEATDRNPAILLPQKAYLNKWGIKFTAERKSKFRIANASSTSGIILQSTCLFSIRFKQSTIESTRSITS